MKGLGPSSNFLGRTNPSPHCHRRPQPAPTTSSTESVRALAFTLWVGTLLSLGAALIHTLVTLQLGALGAGASVSVLWMLATAVHNRPHGQDCPDDRRGQAPLSTLLQLSSLLKAVVVPAAVFAAVRFLSNVMGHFPADSSAIRLVR